MKAVGGGGGGGGEGGGRGRGRRQTTVSMAVDGKWAASSPVVVGGGKAIVGGQLTIAG